MKLNIFQFIKDTQKKVSDNEKCLDEKMSSFDKEWDKWNKTVKIKRTWTPPKKYP